MLSLGLVDSRAISKFNAGSEKHVREVIKRISTHYKLYYLPTTHAFLDGISDDRLKEIKKYANVPSFFESVLDRRPRVTLGRELFTFSPLSKELKDGYEKEIGGLDFIYVPHNYRIQLMSSLLLSELGRKYGMLLMTDPHNSLLEKESFLNCIKNWTKIWSNRKSAIEFCSIQRLQNIIFLTKSLRKKPSFIAVMNDGVFKYTNLPKYFNLRVLSPPHAFNPLALKYRNFEKDNYIVFLGRINTAKGANEALEVGKHFKLKMIGYSEQESIVKQAKNLSIEVIENASEEEKYEILSRAKGLILPSHQEAFSVTVLEALAVGTPVITYDLPSLTSVYKFKPVFFVREFDVASLARKVEEIVTFNNEKVEKMFTDVQLNEFIALHSSWDNVANAIDSMIKNFI